MEYLLATFPIEKMNAVFDNDVNVCLYGEGFGGGIQKGGGLSQVDQGFILFDVRVGEVWLKREDVKNIAYDSLGIPVVPTVGQGTLEEAVDFVRMGANSWVNSDHEMEGLVMRPEVELLDRMGRRIITKVKAKDFR